jgi:glycosyltransferase involved in cell wall biosynthesis
MINEYPPSTAAGAPVISRQLLRYYPPEQLDIVCCASWYDRATPTVRETFLPSRHTVIPSFRYGLRPRRIFSPIETTLDCLRVPKIMAAGRKIIEERKIEALFTISFGPEMPHAAYFLSRELGLPLYYFETDRLDAYFFNRFAKKLITENRRPFLRSVKKLWLTSPKMVRDFKAEYGVDGEYLFHFLDVDACQAAARAAPPLPRDRIRLVYTGSINAMFYDTMKWWCDRLNRGLSIDGRPVELTIYAATCPPELLGKAVRWAGLVKLEQIPEKLAEAHAALILVSFTQDPGIRAQIETSLYTKTVDYLAAGRPVLIVSPPYSAEVDCFRDVTCVVGEVDESAIVGAIRRLVDDQAYAEDLRQKGLAMVQEKHSLAALDKNFLSYFRREGRA